VVAITDGNDALLKLSMSESATNAPSILLTDEDYGNGGSISSIKMPTLFSNNMVLQRDKPIKVWGEVSPNEPVVITFDGQNYNTQCDANGKFSSVLPSKSVSQQIYTMKITANNDSLTYSNIVMGDVYLCGGQSNMAFKVNTVKTDQLDNAKADSDLSQFAVF